MVLISDKKNSLIPDSYC